MKGGRGVKYLCGACDFNSCCHKTKSTNKKTQLFLKRLEWSLAGALCAGVALPARGLGRSPSCLLVLRDTPHRLGSSQSVLIFPWTWGPKLKSCNCRIRV